MADFGGRLGLVEPFRRNPAVVYTARAACRPASPCPAFLRGGQGNLETILSPPSSPVQNVNDKPNGAPQLVGAAREEDALVVDTSMISDDDGLGNFSIIWQRSSTKTEWQAFPETNGEVLQLSQRHVGYSYRAVVSYSDGHGTKELLVTSPSETVQNVDDPVQGEVLIKGEATEGETILVSTSGVSDEDGIASMSIGWEASTDGRNWRAIETGGSTQLALNQPLVNKQIRARVAVVDSFGVETVIFSQATNTVRNVNNKPAGTIFVRRLADKANPIKSRARDIRKGPEGSFFVA